MTGNDATIDVARQTLHTTVREQLERSVPTGSLGIDGPEIVAGEIIQSLFRPSLADALLLVSRDVAQQAAPRMRLGWVNLFTRRPRKGDRALPLPDVRPSPP